MPSPAYSALLNSAREQLGLPSDRSKWTPSQRGEYIRAVSRAVLASPALYTEAERKAALAGSRSDVQDGPGDYTLAEGAGDFFGEFANQAGEVVGSVASVGEGVKSALNLAKWLIPAALIGGVLIYALSRPETAKAIKAVAR